MKTCDFIELVQSDLQGLSREQLRCSDCIKAYCPSRTVALLQGRSFILCGARKATAPVLNAYRQRIQQESVK